MRVDAVELQPVLFQNFFDRSRVFVPNAEGGIRPADVGFSRAAGSHARIEAHADARARERAPEALELVERARVELDAAAQKLREIFRKLLRRKRNFFGGNAGEHRAADFVDAGRVEMQAERKEKPQHGGVRARLDREAHRQPERVREREAGGGVRAERLFVVDVKRRAEALGERGGFFRGKKGMLRHKIFFSEIFGKNYRGSARGSEVFSRGGNVI